MRRFPLMLCPRWTAIQTQPIALADVGDVLARVVADPALSGTVLEVGGPDVLSYRG